MLYLWALLLLNKSLLSHTFNDSSIAEGNFTVYPKSPEILKEASLYLQLSNNISRSNSSFDAHSEWTYSIITENSDEILLSRYIHGECIRNVNYHVGIVKECGPGFIILHYMSRIHNNSIVKFSTYFGTYNSDPIVLNNKYDVTIHGNIHEKFTGIVVSDYPYVDETSNDSIIYFYNPDDLYSISSYVICDPMDSECSTYPIDLPFEHKDINITITNGAILSITGNTYILRIKETSILHGFSYGFKYYRKSSKIRLENVILTAPYFFDRLVDMKEWGDILFELKISPFITSITFGILIDCINKFVYIGACDTKIGTDFCCYFVENELVQLFNGRKFILKNPIKVSYTIISEINVEVNNKYSTFYELLNKDPFLPPTESYTSAVSAFFFDITTVFFYICLSMFVQCNLNLRFFIK